jgi:hypothetical protein
MDDFIGIYDGVTRKDSYDLTISQHQEWIDVANLMMASVQEHLRHYMDKYRMLLIGALSPMVAHPASGEPVALSLANFDECGRPNIDALMQSMYRCGQDLSAE